LFFRNVKGAVCLCAALLVVAIAPGAALARGHAGPSIVARNAIVIDVATGDILYAKQADEQAPPASLTKLFTAAYALDMSSPDAEMTVDAADLVGEANIGLHAGETLSLDTLLHGMLMASGNDAAMVVARSAAALTGDDHWQATQRFLDYANARDAALGLTETHLANPHGLDEAGHYSSAHDIAAITLYIARNQPNLLAMAGSASWSGDGHVFANTNQLLGRYPDLIAGKTGFTADAGYCLVEVAQRGGRAVIAVLLGSTEDAWYTDATALLDYGFSVGADPGTHPLGQITLQPAAAAVGSVANPSVVADVTRMADDTSLVRGAEHDRSGYVDWRLAVVVVFALALVSLAVAAWPRGRRHSRRVDALEPAPVASQPSPRQWDTGPLHIGAPLPEMSFDSRYLLEETEAFPVLGTQSGDAQSTRATPPRKIAAIRPVDRRLAAGTTTRWPRYRLGDTD